MYLEALGYDVCHSIVFGITSTDKPRRYNSIAMSFILSGLPDSVKSNVGQRSSAKHLWEKLQNLYVKKHAGQDEDDGSDSTVIGFLFVFEFDHF